MSKGVSTADMVAAQQQQQQDRQTDSHRLRRRSKDGLWLHLVPLLVVLRVLREARRRRFEPSRRLGLGRRHALPHRALPHGRRHRLTRLRPTRLPALPEGSKAGNRWFWRQLARAPEAVAWRLVGRSLGSAGPARAIRRALRRRGSRPRALPGGHFDHAALPDCGHVRLERGEDLADLRQHLRAPDPLLGIVRVRARAGARVRVRVRGRVGIRARSRAKVPPRPLTLSATSL